MRERKINEMDKRKGETRELNRGGGWVRERNKVEKENDETSKAEETG